MSTIIHTITARVRTSARRGDDVAMAEPDPGHWGIAPSMAGRNVVGNLGLPVRLGLWRVVTHVAMTES